MSQNRRFYVSAQQFPVRPRIGASYYCCCGGAPPRTTAAELWPAETAADYVVQMQIQNTNTNTNTNANTRYPVSWVDRFCACRALFDSSPLGHRGFWKKVNLEMIRNTNRGFWKKVHLSKILTSARLIWPLPGLRQTKSVKFYYVLHCIAF